MRKGLSLLCLIGLFLSCIAGCGTPAGIPETDTKKPDGATESESGVPVPDDGTIRSGSVQLKTASASMEIRIGTDGELEICSLRTESYENIQKPQVLSQPSFGSELTFEGAFPYRTERRSEGYRFHYAGTDLEYDLYAVAHESWSGPFEFWATVRNGGNEPVNYSVIESPSMG